MYRNMTSAALWARESQRYTQTSAYAAPDLERLRREIYHYPAEPASAAP
jgi:heptaprenyl diphosphate synthase